MMPLSIALKLFRLSNRNPSKISTSILAIISSCFFLASAAASTDELSELSLEDIINLDVSVASKKSESIYDAPGIISVISKAEIHGFAAQNLGQVLNRVVGAQFLSPDVFVDQSIGFRGQELTPYNNHVLILMNGRPVRDPISGGMNSPILAGFPLDSIDKIEIIRGPGSVLYGSAAYSAVINIVVTSPEEEELAGSVSAGMGSYHGSNGSFDISHNNGVIKSHTAGYIQEDKGPRYTFTDYAGVLDTDRFNRQTRSLISNIEYGNFDLNLIISDFQPNSLDGSEIWENKDYVNTHETYFADLTYSKTFTDRFSVDLNGTYNEHLWRGISNTTGELSDTHGVAYMSEVTAKYAATDKFNVLLGGGYEYSHWTGARLVDGNLHSGFTYAQMDYQITDKTKLIAGMQWNKIQRIDAETSPRIGLIHHINERMGTKLLYSEAFRKGYPLETSFAVVVFRGNLLLEPEKIKTYEAQFFYHTDKMEHTITYFDSKMVNRVTRQRIVDTSLPRGFYLQYLNGGEWEFKGIEYEGKYGLTPSIFLTGSASYQTNEDSTSDVEDATLHPNTQVKLGVLFTQPDYSLGIYHSYFGDPEQTTKVDSSSNEINERPSSINLLSAKYTKDLSQELGVASGNALEVSIEGENLLNKEMIYPDFPNKTVNSLMPLSAGRTVHAEVKYKF